MKIKKNDESFFSVLKSMTSTSNPAVSTFMSFDVKDGIIVENFGKLLDYNSESLSLTSGDKTIYLYGENLKIVTFSRTVMHIQGKINKIELFEVK